MLKIECITKTYPGVRALKGVSLTVEAGTVHGLLGENGAGKSTLMKILAGSETPDSGRIIIDGKPLPPSSVSQVRSQRMAIVYQELSLFNNLTVAQNIFVTKEPMSLGLIDDHSMEREAGELLDYYGIPIRASSPLSQLSIPERQLVEILKGICQGPRILMLDEPTSSLGENEANLLFSIMARLKDQGCAIIYISHKMGEIFRICDVVSVLRDGSYIGTKKIHQVDQASLVKMMIGRDLSHAFPPKGNFIQEEKPLLEVEKITHQPYYKEVTFQIRRGEIYGFYGLVGAGRTEILKGLFGILPPRKGSIRIGGRKVSLTHPSQAINEGIAFVTENRKEEGLVLLSSIKENLSMVSLDHLLSRGFIDSQKEEALAQRHMRELQIKASHSGQRVHTLSGGNQQKVVLGKWFEHNPQILILDEPTRGIDVGAKLEIYKLIQKLAQEGVAIILVSSELSEVLSLCNTLGLVKDSCLIHQSSSDDITEDQILHKLTE